MSQIAAPASPQRRTLLPASLVGAVSSGVGLQCALAISGILAARVLGPSNRGTLALFVVLTSVCAQLGAVGLSVAAAYFIARDRLAARGIARRLVRPGLVQATAVSLIYLIVITTIFRGRGGSVLAAAWASVLLIPASYCLDYGFAFLQGLGRLRAYNSLRVLPNGLYSVVLVIGFLAGFRSLGQIVALAVGSWLIAASVVGLAARRAVRSLRRSHDHTAPALAELFAFGWRSALGLMSSVDSFRLDQLLVAALLSTRALGVYVVAAAFTNLPRFVAQSIGAVAFPAVAASRGSGGHARQYIVFGVGVSLAISTGLTLAMQPLVDVLFGARFADAVTPARILAMGAVFFAARRLVSDVARGYGFPTLGSYGEAVTLLAFLVSAPLLSPVWGLDGIAAAYGAAGAAGLLVVVALGLRKGLK